VAPPPPPEVPAYYDLPEILAQVPVPGGGFRLLELGVSLRLGSLDDVPAVQDAVPRIRDAFQVYIRDNGLIDPERPADRDRMRAAMLARIRALVAPARVTEVLFREVIVQ
jgi:flagellar FliL protein